MTSVEDRDEKRLRTAQHAPLVQRLIIEALVEEKRLLRGALVQIREHPDHADAVRFCAHTALSATDPLTGDVEPSPVADDEIPWIEVEEQADESAVMDPHLRELARQGWEKLLGFPIRASDV